jgi:hypothetical protein
MGPSLTRGRVCSFQFLLGIASSAFLRSESHGTDEHILFQIGHWISWTLNTVSNLKPHVYKSRYPPVRDNMFLSLPCMSRDSLLTRWATGWMVGFESWKGQEIFLYCTAAGPSLGPTQSMRWIPGILS